MQRAHGALEQVGGAVARERLRDATEAFDLAESYEREIEAEYESWKLLLEQMKEADRGAGQQPRTGARPVHRSPVSGIDAASLRERPTHGATRHRRSCGGRCCEIAVR